MWFVPFLTQKDDNLNKNLIFCKKLLQCFLLLSNIYKGLKWIYKFFYQNTQPKCFDKKLQCLHTLREKDREKEKVAVFFKHMERS